MKKFYARIVKDASLGPRQARIIISDGTLDRVKDIMVAEGCDTSDYEKNPIVLAQHDAEHPVGTAVVETKAGRVVLLVNFAPEGISRRADEYCGLVKSGVIRAGSIGFEPVEFEPIPEGGYRYIKWKLMEASFVSVPANPNALVIQRSYGRRNRKCAPAVAQAREAHLKALGSIFRKTAVVHRKGANLHDYLHDRLVAYTDKGVSHVKALTKSTDSQAREAHLKALGSIFTKMAQLHRKGAVLHDYLHDQLVAEMGHGTSHVNELMKMSSIEDFRPSTNIEDQRNTDDADQREPSDDTPDDTALPRDDDDDGEREPNTFDDLRNDRDDDPDDLPIRRKPCDDDEECSDQELAYAPPQQKDGMPYRWDPSAGASNNIFNDRRWEARGRRVEGWEPIT